MTTELREILARRGDLRAGPAGLLGRYDKPGHRLLLLIAPAFILFFAVYAIPVGQMLLLSFSDSGWTFKHYVALVKNPFVLRILANTIRLSLQVTLLCLLLGYPVAYLMLKAGVRVRYIILILVTAPVWTSVLVRAYAWMVFLGRQGLVNQALQRIGITEAPLPLLYNQFSVHVGMVHIMLPFMILPLFSVMKRIDVNLVSAAQSLGASPTAAFVWVFFPLSLPGVAAGALLVFILSLGFFVTPAILGGLKDVTYVMLVEKEVNELLHWELASAMTVILLVVTLGLIILYQSVLGFSEGQASGASATERGRWFARGPAVGMAIASRAVIRLGGGRFRPRRVLFTRDNPGQRRSYYPAKPRIRIPVVHVVAWGVIIFLVLPLVLLFPLALSGSPFLEFPPRTLSFQWFRNYFARPDWVRPTVVSFKVAALTMVVATSVGTLAAIGLVRGRFRGKAVLTAFLLSPIVVPSIVVAIALYFQFSRLGLVGSSTGLVLGHLVLAVPMVVVVVTGALQSVDDSLERAAMSLGAGRVKAFLRVTLPLIRPAVLSGAFFAFLASFDDVVIALFISGTGAVTLPKRMWEGIRFEVDPTIAAVSTLIILCSIFLLLIAEVVRVHAQQISGIIKDR